MSKSCSFCGAEMADDAVQCPECEKYIRGYVKGKKIKKDETVQKKKTIIITCCTAVFAVLLFIFVNAVLNVVNKNKMEADADYIKVFDKYIEACLDCDYDKFISLYPEFYAQEIDGMFTYISGNGQDYLTKLKEDMVEQFGYINDITYEVKSEAVVSDSQIQTTISEWKTLYEIKQDPDVSAIYNVTLNFKISGRNSSYDNDQTISFARIDGKWYIMNIVYFLDTSKMAQ